MATGKRRRFRNPRGGGGSIVTTLLPWVAIGGLLYLMAQNAGKLKTPAQAGSASAVGAGGTQVDFGVTSQCWSC